MIDITAQTSISFHAGRTVRDAISRWICRLILPYLFLAALSEELFETPGETIFLLGMAAYLILLAADGKKPALLLYGSDTVIALAMVSAVLSCLGTDWVNRGGNLTTFLIREGFGLLSMIIALHVYAYHRDDFRISLRILSWIIWLTAATGMLTYLLPADAVAERTGWDTSSWKQITSNERLCFPFTHPIISAHCWLIGLWLPLSGRRKADWALKIIYIAGIFFTQSRSSWAGLAVSMVLYLFQMRGAIAAAWKRLAIPVRGLAIAALAAVIVVILQIPTVQEILISRLTGITSTDPYTVRTSHAAYVIRDFLQKGWREILFGSGQNTVQELIMDSYLMTESKYIVADNSYISLMYDYGLITLAAVLLVCWKALRLLLRTKKREGILGSGSLALLGGMAVIFFYDVQYFLTTSMLMMTLAAMVIVEYRESRVAGESPRESGEEGRRPRRRGIR